MMDDIDSIVLLQTALEQYQNGERGKWYPDGIYGRWLFGISDSEWREIEKSRDETLRTLIDNQIPGDIDEIFLKLIRHDRKFIQAPFFNKWFLSLSTKPGILEKYAQVFRDPVTTNLIDAFEAILLHCWCDHVYKFFPSQIDVPPFCFWTYDSISDFAYEIFDQKITPVAVRSRIRKMKLKRASLVLVNEFTGKDSDSIFIGFCEKPASGKKAT